MTTALNVPDVLNDKEGSANSGLYTVFDEDMQPQYVGHSDDIRNSLKAHVNAVGPSRCAFVEVMGGAVIGDVDVNHLINQKVRILGVTPPGNSAESWKWNGKMTLPVEEKEEEEEEAREEDTEEMPQSSSSDEAIPQAEAKISPFARQPADGAPNPTPPAAAEAASAAASSSSASPSSPSMEMNLENVDYVLDTIRPVLIQDGGNVAVVSVVDGVVAVRLEGACGSCASSSATMTHGIEAALRNSFGDQLKEVTQVAFTKPATLDAVNEHLALFKPALHRFSGDIECVSVLDGVATVMWKGPEVMYNSVVKALEDRFPSQLVRVERVAWMSEENNKDGAGAPANST